MDNVITFTEPAKKHIAKTLSLATIDALHVPLGLRLGVKPAGCSGNAYIFELAYEQGPSDQIIEIDDLKVYIEAKSLPYIQGMELDYVNQGMNGHIKFNNPNVKSECGCGESFNTEK